MDAWMEVWMYHPYGWMEVWMYVCMVLVDVCMYVCMTDEKDFRIASELKPKI